MPEPKIKNKKNAGKNAKQMGTATGGDDDSSGFGFSLLDKLSPGAIFKIKILDLIKDSNPFGFIIPKFGGANKEGSLKKMAGDLMSKMLYSLTCSGCCTCLPLILVLILVSAFINMVSDLLNF